MSVADNTTRLKDICDSLASINVTIEEDEMVKVCLGVGIELRSIRTTNCTRENTPSFFDLQSMLLVEENHAGASTSTHADNKMLYTEEDMPSRHGG